MIDCVIPLGNRSTVRNLELCFALRSIQKHLKGVGKIWVIGECPDWLQNIIHVPCTDDPRSRFKERNIVNKMLAACKDQRVSNDFLMWHDDHFLLEDTKASGFPTVHHGKINPGPGQYGETKKNTMAVLGEVNDYDSHCPILFNKEKFAKTMSKLDWNKWYGYLIKTVYCIQNGISAEYYPDLKVRHVKSTEELKGLIAGRRWFSTGDRCFTGGWMKAVLEELYSEKSIYER